MAISQRPRGTALLMVRDFNTDLAVPKGRPRDEKIAAAMATAGLEDMSRHFLPQHKLWLKDSRTWYMRRGGQEVRSRTYYILVTERFLLQNVTVQYARHNTDHYLVLGCFHVSAPATNLRYPRKQTRFPINPLTSLYCVNRMFTELWSVIINPPWQ